MVPSVQLTKFRSSRVTRNWLERLSLRSRSVSSPAGPGRICFPLPFKAAKWRCTHSRPWASYVGPWQAAPSYPNQEREAVKQRRTPAWLKRLQKVKNPRATGQAPAFVAWHRNPN